MIQIKNLSKNYGSLEIFKDINFDINQGEFVSVIGPSGCGKSTLINILAGLEKSTSGQVFFEEKEISGTDTQRLMIFQSPALFPWMSVADNVSCGLKNITSNKNEIKTKVDEILRKVYLYKFKDYYPHQLSGGMKQRVAIARSMVMNPKVLLMDEPFSALDEQTRMLLHSELQKIWMETRKTIVFVTHNIREAVKLSTKVILLGTKPGRIVEEIEIDLSFPRMIDNPELFTIEKKLYGKLKIEMEKIAKEEMGDEYSLEKDNISSGVGNTLGGGI